MAYDPVFWTTYQYDSLDRTTVEDAPVSEAQPAGATTTYQYVDRDVWVTDAENHLTKYENNAVAQIAKVTDALNGVTAYAYKPFGELGSVTDTEGKITTIDYDPRGFKSAMADPNMGNWVYDYNVFGELAGQRSPITASPNWTVRFAYDAAARVATRTDRDGSTDTGTSFVYYPSGAAAGKRGKVDTISMPNHIEKYDYHGTYGTPTLLRRTLEGTAYDFNMTYDAEARLNLLTYPESSIGYRFAVDYDYDSFGHMSTVRESGGSGTTFYSLTEADALGREVNLSLGNGLTEYRTFDRASGHLTDIETGPSLSASIQNLSFTFDEVGNVKTRTNSVIGKTETFGYDALNRMTSAQVTSLAAVNVAYSAAGRITSKSDYGGTYTYGTPTRPYAVTAAGGQSYAYDAAGRMTTHGADTFTWYPYDLPKLLATGTKSSEFFYGVGRERYKQIQKTGSTTDATIYYVGTLFEKEVAAATTYRHYVSARDRMVAAVNRVGTTNTVQYLHRDHQGSVVEVTGTTGTLVQSLAFDAWGLRRNPATWAALGTPFSGTEPTERGYTGHEHLDRVELIHMNGRVQDPRLGRFISADPLVQAPYHSQSFNRYSYVWNNPASLLDPSGFGAEQSCDGCYQTTVTGHQPPDSDDTIRAYMQAMGYNLDGGASDGANIGGGAGAATVYSSVNSVGIPVFTFRYDPPRKRECEGLCRDPNAWRSSPASFVAGMAPGYDLLTAFTNSEATRLDYVVGVLGIAPGGDKAAGFVARLVGKAARATAAATRGTSVLGHYPAYLEKAAELGARRFSVPPEIWARMSPAERLAANGKFLDRLVARGDEALLTTPVGRATPGSSLEWEINYLLGRGYQVVDDGWRLIPGP